MIMNELSVLAAEDNYTSIKSIGHLYIAYTEQRCMNEPHGGNGKGGTQGSSAPTTQISNTICIYRQSLNPSSAYYYVEMDD